MNPMASALARCLASARRPLTQAWRMYRPARQGTCPTWHGPTRHCARKRGRPTPCPSPPPSALRRARGAGRRPAGIAPGSGAGQECSEAGDSPFSPERCSPLSGGAWRVAAIEPQVAPAHQRVTIRPAFGLSSRRRATTQGAAACGAGSARPLPLRSPGSGVRFSRLRQGADRPGRVGRFFFGAMSSLPAASRLPSGIPSDPSGRASAANPRVWARCPEIGVARTRHRVAAAIRKRTTRALPESATVDTAAERRRNRRVAPRHKRATGRWVQAATRVHDVSPAVVPFARPRNLRLKRPPVGTILQARIRRANRHFAAGSDVRAPCARCAASNAAPHTRAVASTASRAGGEPPACVRRVRQLELSTGARARQVPERERHHLDQPPASVAGSHHRPPQ